MSRPHFERLRDVYIPAVFVSLGISAWSVYYDDVVNPDGTLYLRTAARFVQGEWREAFSIYPWPFYPYLISLFSQLSGITLEYSAHCINALFCATIVGAFVALTKEVGGDKRVLLASALVILFYHSLNEYRSYVIRDFGYLAFYLLGVLVFLKYYSNPRWYLALLWGTTMAVATLFRREGFVFLACLPLVLFFKCGISWRAKVRAYVIGNAVLAAGVIAAFVFTSPLEIFQERSESYVGSVLPILSREIPSVVSHDLPQKIEALKTSVLADKSAGYALHILVGSLALILFFEILKTLTPFLALLACYGLYCRILFPLKEFMRIWIWLVLLNVLVLAVVVVAHFYLTGRFPLALALTISLAVPFSLVKIYDSWKARRGLAWKRNWFFPVVAGIFVASAVAGLVSFSGGSKKHIKEAGLWIRENTPRDTKVFTNDEVLSFYMDKTWQGNHSRYDWDETVRILSSGQWKACKYVALRIKRGHPERKQVVLESVGTEPLKSFRNARGDQVLVFKTETGSE